MFVRRSSLIGSIVALGVVAGGCSGVVHSNDIRDEVGVAPALEPQGQMADVVEWDDTRAAASVEEQALAQAQTGPQIVFLNRAGRTYTSGNNDSERGTSSIVGGRASSVTVPPAPFSERDWATILSCVQQEYAPWNVVITDRRPASGPYIEAAVGGRSSILGLGSSVTGISPMRCGVIARSVAFVFADHPALTRSTEEACITIAHEVGHSVGLEHSPISADPMTYLRFDGHKTFQDEESQCGTGFGSQPCQCGNSQNTVQRLTRNLGPSRGNPSPDPPPTPDPTDQLTIVSPDDGATLPANSRVTVVVKAADGLADVGLFWEFAQRTLPCDDSVANASCTQSGSTYTWVLNVGSGERKFRAVATDSSGARVVSATRTIDLTDGTTPPGVATLEIRSPDDGAQLQAGSNVTVEARVSEDTNIGAVMLDWTRPAAGKQAEQTASFALAKVGRGVYRATLLIANAAPAGERRLLVHTTSGSSTIASPSRTVQIIATPIAP